MEPEVFFPPFSLGAKETQELVQLQGEVAGFLTAPVPRPCSPALCSSILSKFSPPPHQPSIPSSLAPSAIPGLHIGQEGVPGWQELGEQCTLYPNQPGLPHVPLRSLMDALGFGCTSLLSTLSSSSNTPDTSSSRDLRFLQTPERALDVMLPGKFCLEKIPRIRKHEGAWESAQSREKWKILRIQINMNWI